MQCFVDFSTYVPKFLHACQTRSFWPGNCSSRIDLVSLSVHGCNSEAHRNSDLQNEATQRNATQFSAKQANLSNTIQNSVEVVEPFKGRGNESGRISSSPRTMQPPHHDA